MSTDSSLGARALPPPNKPHSDRRRYQQLMLANGLEAIVIHDPETDTAAASLDISIGSFQDPPHRQGLAHFLEHLLFMGTEKYTDESEYEVFLSEHGGSSNAYTDDEHTNYFFDVQWNSLEEALDRFSYFFRAPLFDVSCTNRERDSVHAEHEKNIRDDEWRLEQLIRYLAPSTLPLARSFGTGTRKTLAGDEVREDVISFYRSHYRPCHMRLAILGRHPLEEMAGWVVERFTPIPADGGCSNAVDLQKTSAIANDFCGTLNSTPPNQMLSSLVIGQVTVQQCLKAIRRLEFVWFTRPLASHYDTRPLDLIGEMVGDEQKGSLMAYLRTHALASHSLMVECTHNTVFSTLRISIPLTDAGRAEWRRITVLLFRWLEMAPILIEARWKEVSEEKQLSFDYSDASDPTSAVYELSREMHDYPPEERLQGSHLFRKKPNEALIQVLVREDLIPSRCHLLVMEPGQDQQENDEDDLDDNEHDGEEEEKHEHVCKSGQDMVLGSDVVGTLVVNVEPWYGTHFVTQTNVAIEKHEGEADLFMPPAPNAYLPSSLKMVGSTRKGEWCTPKLLRDGLYFKQDDLFGLPKGIIFLFFKFQSQLSANEYVEEMLRITILKEQLAEDLYAATNAGIDHDIELKSSGVLVEVNGFSSKLLLVVEEYCRRLQNIRPGTCMWAEERVRRELLSASKELPYKQTQQLLRQLLQPAAHSPEALLAALDARGKEHSTSKIDVEIEVDGLVHGNFEASEAEAIFAAALRLGGGVPGGRQPLHIPIRELEAGRPLVLVRHRTADAANCLHVFFELGRVVQGSYKEYALALLVAQIAAEPFFDQLRTKEQLGYLVRAQVRFDGNGFGLEFLVQSDRSAAFLWKRVEEFLGWFSTTLTAMGRGEFERHRKALHHRLTERPSKLRIEALPYWAAIWRQDGEFDLCRKTASTLTTGVEKSAVVKYYKEKILCEANRRLAIVGVEQGASSLEIAGALCIVLRPGEALENSI